VLRVQEAHIDSARVDLLDRAAVRECVTRFRPTCIVHCAATGMDFPRPEWFDLIRFNVELTVNLCECAAVIPGCHLISISTGLAYRSSDSAHREDDPLETQHPYGASKAAADILLRSAAAEFGVPLTVLRPFSFTGLGDDRRRLFGTILQAAAKRVPVDLSAGTQVRDHCSARDIADGIVSAMDAEWHADHTARIYNLGSGRTVPLRALIEGIVSEIGLEVQLNFGARPAGRFDPRFLVADIGRATADLGWAPRHNLAHAVWQLATESFPSLSVREPKEVT